ncbi:MAG: SIS domain-containing protein [Desulfatibacillaceae bacterium]
MEHDEKTIIEQARDVLRIEAEGILRLVDTLDSGFARLVEMIYASTGRVIVAGIGKSGIVGRKIVATLNSTGTRALFLHPVEAMHGDLGIVCADDVFLALSNSGETDELNVLLPSIRNLDCPVVAFTGCPDSTLGRQSDVVINVAVEREACPLGLAPTASTTALLAVGDALAVALINKRRFRKRDFRKFHPGGALGQRLASRVLDLMITGDEIPAVGALTPMREVLDEMDRRELGSAIVVGAGNRLVGIITDGDLRRFLVRGESLEGKTAQEMATVNPKFVTPESQVGDALNLMERHQITVLPVADADGVVRGVLHVHDILGKGTVRFNGSS